MSGILVQSEKQWLVSTLESQSPALFQHKAHLPHSLDTLQHLQWGNQHWTIGPAERAMFRGLWCPNESCVRLNKVVSLFDLYGPLFKKAVEQRGLHSMYQWLPLLTSGVNQHFNDSAGRRGLWGLDYLTARKLGLQISDDWDDRCGGDYTTNAAIGYLNELHAKYHDDFTALLIFLHGAPQVLALEQRRYTDLPRDWQLEISFLCYSEHLIRNLRMTNHQHHYFDLMGLFAPIRLKDTLDIAVLQAVLQEDVVALRGMNPTMTSQRLLGGVLKVPYFISLANANRFAAMEDSLYRYTATAAPETIVATRYHKVKRGESLGSIAKKYRVSVKELQRINRLKNTKIRPGQSLAIPSDTAPKEVAAPQPGQTEEPTPPSPAPKKDKKPTTKEEIYVVKSGDSLWKIARKYRGVTEEDIKRWNRCGDDLRPGQKLVIKVKK